MEIATNALQVCSILSENNKECFIVGGCVRDLLLGRIPSDYDIATNALPSEIIEIFEGTFKTIPTGLDHGTITIIVENEPIEVTTYRIDGKYEDGRRPTSVTFVPNIKEDLARRDLTINAIAYNPINQSFLDPFDGKSDLDKQLIKMVGNPHDRLEEDGLRAIRILRFYSQLGFTIESDTLTAISDHLDTFSKVSIERIILELSKLFNGPYFSKSVEFLFQTQLAFRICDKFDNPLLFEKHPTLNFTRIDIIINLFKLIDDSIPLNMKFAVFFHQLSVLPSLAKETIFPPFRFKFFESLLKQLKLSNEKIKEILLFLKFFSKSFPYSTDDSNSNKDYETRKLLFHLNSEQTHDWCKLKLAQEKLIGKAAKSSTLSDLVKDLQHRLLLTSPIRMKDLKINGDVVIDFFRLNKKIKTHREFIGLVLNILRDKVEFNPSLNNPDQFSIELNRINQIFSKCSASKGQKISYIATDSVRKIISGQSPSYSKLESKHTYELSQWLITCQLFNSKSIIIFEGTNIDLFINKRYMKNFMEQFTPFKAILIFFTVSEDQAKLNVKIREKEENYLGKSDAGFETFNYFNKKITLLDHSIFNQEHIFTVNTRDSNLDQTLNEILSYLKEHKFRLIVLCGNVLSGKTYTAKMLSELLISKKEF